MKSRQYKKCRCKKDKNGYLPTFPTVAFLRCSKCHHVIEDYGKISDVELV